MTHGAFSWCVAAGHRRPSVAASEFETIRSGCRGKHLLLIMWQLWKKNVPMFSLVFQDVSAPLSAVDGQSFNVLTVKTETLAG